MGDFFGLRIALSGLNAQRRGIDVTGHNIANANTVGYSRQRVGMLADAGPLTPAIHFRWEQGGQGVEVGPNERLRDQFLELRGYQEHALAAGLERSQGVLSRIELSFAEPSDTGLAAQMSNFFAGWDDAVNRPDDVAARAQLVERANTLTAGFRQIDDAMTGLAESSRAQLGAIVSEVNADATRVAELNHSIQAAVLADLVPSDLMDQRDVLIGRIADRVGATIRPGELGAMDVFVGGTAIVRGVRAEALVAPPAGGDRITWAKDGGAGSAVIVGGEAGALLGALTDTIPRYREELRTVADDLASAVNRLHEAGFDLDEAAAGATGPRDPADGRSFFLLDPGPNGVVTFRVNPEITADPRKVAASATGAVHDAGIALAVAKAAGGPDSSYQDLIVRLGVETQTVGRRVDIQGAIVDQVDMARESESGVNIDEEMVQLVAYQHAYSAAARLMTTVDEMLDKLINGTGVVGR